MANFDPTSEPAEKTGRVFPMNVLLLFIDIFIHHKMIVEKKIQSKIKKCNVTEVRWQIQFRVCVQKLHSHKSERIIKIDPRLTKLC